MEEDEWADATDSVIESIPITDQDLQYQPKKHNRPNQGPVIHDAQWFRDHCDGPMDAEDVAFVAEDSDKDLRKGLKTQMKLNEKATKPYDYESAQKAVSSDDDSGEEEEEEEDDEEEEEEEESSESESDDPDVGQTSSDEESVDSAPTPQDIDLFNQMPKKFKKQIMEMAGLSESGKRLRSEPSPTSRSAKRVTRAAPAMDEAVAGCEHFVYDFQTKGGRIAKLAFRVCVDSANNKFYGIENSFQTAFHENCHTFHYPTIFSKMHADKICWKILSEMFENFENVENLCPQIISRRTGRPPRVIPIEIFIMVLEHTQVSFQETYLPHDWKSTVQADLLQLLGKLAADNSDVECIRLALRRLLIYTQSTVSLVETQKQLQRDMKSAMDHSVQITEMQNSIAELHAKLDVLLARPS
eukprot:TRINITY_DN15728_c0_g1_i1.p1 TRINITY_DN15728_c0_g1~~TRINITY_DN15728_c0_g1_i1.p1  ORF type:complete len:430 (-),score=81.89 TRINITY_DN15728_c0_g1_i1:34-1272(-)